MKKLMAALVVMGGLAIASGASAVTYTYNLVPTPADMNDLDHYKYYYWSITNLDLNDGEVITGATLTFTNIWDWKAGELDWLYIRLFDYKPTTGITLNPTTPQTYPDYTSQLFWGTDNNNGDNFSPRNGVQPAGTSLPTWSDPAGGSPRNFNLVYDFSIIPYNGSNLLSLLDSYIRNNGDFGLGIDPDCHYNNDGVRLTITTNRVPEPGTLLLLGAGLLGLGIVRRRRS